MWDSDWLGMCNSAGEGRTNGQSHEDSETVPMLSGSVLLPGDIHVILKL